MTLSVRHTRKNGHKSDIRLTISYSQRAHNRLSTQYKPRDAPCRYYSMTQICITATAVTSSQLTGWLHLIPADIYLSVRDGVEAMFMRLRPAVSNSSVNVIHTSHCSRACNCYLCNCLTRVLRIYHPRDRYWNGFAITY